MQHLLSQIEERLASDQAGEFLCALAEVLAYALEERREVINELGPSVKDIPDLMRQIGTAIDGSLEDSV